jgi:hypothetical protein
MVSFQWLAARCAVTASNQGLPEYDWALSEPQTEMIGAWLPSVRVWPFRCTSACVPTMMKVLQILQPVVPNITHEMVR